MRIVRTLGEARARGAVFRRAGLSLGFVPTLGALHQGHASLLDRSRAECDRTAASIFLNPTQFGPGEDLARYPRTTERDLEILSAAGVHLVLLGDPLDVYPPGYQTWVEVEDLSRPLCGEHRPGHFRGVATVVAILLSAFDPDRAYFGLKDIQQCRIVARMARDLRLRAEIRLCATVREPDGLAMSSRNVYLDAQARERARAIPRALEAGRARLAAGERSARRVREALLEALRPGEDLAVEYAEACHPDTLLPFPGDALPESGRGILLAIAVRVHGTRLIDNAIIE